MQYQNLVNELIKNMIMLSEDIFPGEVAGPSYEKFLSRDSLDMEDMPPHTIEEDETTTSEDGVLIVLF